MTTPAILPPDSLSGVDVGLSVSDSADLDRLGLTVRHADITVGEVARAVLVGGGTLTYGGWIKPSSFTDLLMHEVRRYGTRAGSVTFCLALPQHRRLTLSELRNYDRGLGAAGRLLYLDADGSPIRANLGRVEAAETLEDPEVLGASYTGLRRYMAQHTNARVIVGGQLSGFQGVMPGVIEEAITSVAAEQPLYVCGGFGGAGAAIVDALDMADMSWLPPDMPLHGADPAVVQSLDLLRIAAMASTRSVLDNGLTPGQMAELAASHRAGEIASLVAQGLARAFAGS